MGEQTAAPVMPGSTEEPEIAPELIQPLSADRLNAQQVLDEPVKEYPQLN